MPAVSGRRVPDGRRRPVTREIASGPGDPDDTPHRLLVLTATVGAGAITTGVTRYRARTRPPVPLTTRLVLGGSLLTWMLCGMGLQRFVLGRLSRRRILLGLFGTVPTIAVTVAVRDPGLLLGITAAILVGSAVTVSPQIAEVRDERSHEGAQSRAL